MSVSVRIPGPLRRYTNNVDKVAAEPGALGAIVDALDADYPGIRDRILDEQGEMRYFVNVYLNGEDVRFLDGLSTEVKEGDELSIVPAVAGGA